MAEELIVQVAVDHIVYYLDKLYDYKISADWANSIKPGCRVLVPFGAGNKKRKGIVLQTAFSSNTDKLKTVFAVLDSAPLLNSEMLNLARVMKQKYFCTIFDAIKLMIPAGLNFKLQEHFRIVTEAEVEAKGSFLYDENEKNLISYLQSERTWFSKEHLLNKFGAPVLESLKSLTMRGMIEKKEVEKRTLADAKVRMLGLKQVLPEGLKLTPKQNMVYELLQSKDNKSCSLKEML